jgi:hypothetical protein
LTAPTDISAVGPFVIPVTIPLYPAVDVDVSTSVVLVVPTPGPPGQTGPTGPSGNGTQVFGEVPSGTLNGSNETFTVSNSFQTGTTCVYRNGLREHLGVGYTESSPELLFTTPPLGSDVITVDYLVEA